MVPMEKMKEFFKENDKLAQHLGIELLEMAPGFAKASMTVTPELLNGVNTAHGGAIFSLADLVFAAACNSHNQISVAINVSINFIKAALPNTTLIAEGHEVSRNSRLGVYDVKVTDESGDLVAAFEGLAYRKKDPLVK
ncbi:MAG: hydroxyphenylacetyl-CoA thioesterase PaaI [Sedimentisphaerales bacterium]|nr:hydroxyphenylacetyl-CoA thioesterase PaaI [Sedimentisphaerales bacterium]